MYNQNKTMIESIPRAVQRDPQNALLCVLAHSNLCLIRRTAGTLRVYYENIQRHRGTRKLMAVHLM